MQYLSLSVARFISFMYSPAFKGTLIIAALLFDIFTTSLGMAPFVFKKLDMLFEHTTLSKGMGATFAVSVCALSAALMAGSLTVASMHRKYVMSFFIGVTAFLVSFGGVAKGMFHITGLHDLNFDTIINLLCVLAFTGGPILYYSLNSGLIYQQFGEEIRSINNASSDKIKTVMIERAEEDLNAQGTKEKAGTIKNMLKHAKSLWQSEEKMKALTPKKEAKSTATYEDLLKQLNAN